MLPLLKDCKICSAKCRVFMVTVQDSLISAGAQSSDLEAILEALENDSIGHSLEEEASGPFTELNPAVLGQSPLRLNVKRCNIVKMAIRGAKGGHVDCARDQCLLVSLLHFFENLHLHFTLVQTTEVAE